MLIEHVLAVVPATDVERSQRWYEALFGRAPDNNPMPTLVEWQVVPGGWVQVFADDQHVGSTVVNFAVKDLDTHIDELKQRGLEPGEIVAHRPGREHSHADRRLPRSVLRSLLVYCYRYARHEHSFAGGGLR
jgi:glyoxylase I family protein